MTGTMIEWHEDFEYRCPECGGDHLKVYAEESKIVYLNRPALRGRGLPVSQKDAR
jgi:hypothetical protein